MGRFHFYSDVQPQQIGQHSQSNPTYRAIHHFKEAEVHDPPPRRNNDFKPVHSWSAKGLPNYKHSEPFYLTKNMTQFIREEQGFMFRWTKRFLEGAFFGFVVGAFSHNLMPMKTHVHNQLELSAGNASLPI